MVPEYTVTGGEDALELARLARMEPDEWQGRVVYGALGQDRYGHPTAAEVGLIVGRQNGKGGCIEIVSLNGLYLRRHKMVYTAHLMATSRKIRERIQFLIESVPDFDKEVKQIRTANEEQSIVLKPQPTIISSASAISVRDEPRIDFVARTSNAARGWAGYDVVFFDEAFALTSTMVGALMPIMFARQDWQIWYVSMGGMANSDALRQVRARALTGEPELAYYEWSVPEDVYRLAPQYVANMPAAWEQANPAAGGRISYKTLKNAQRAMDPGEFAREVLCVWDDPGGALLIPIPLWNRLIDPTSQIVSQMVMAIDCSPGLVSGCIGVAGYRSDGIPHVEITSRDGVLDHRAGTDWVVPRVKELDDAWHPVAWMMDASGPGRALLTDLAKVGIEPVLLSSRELGEACGSLLIDATGADSNRLRHLGQQNIVDAIKAAQKRDIVDAWIFSRRASDQDITPLMMVTMALHGLAVHDVQMYDVLESVR